MNVITTHTPALNSPLSVTRSPAPALNSPLYVTRSPALNSPLSVTHEQEHEYEYHASYYQDPNNPAVHCVFICSSTWRLYLLLRWVTFWLIITYTWTCSTCCDVLSYFRRNFYSNSKILIVVWPITGAFYPKYILWLRQMCARMLFTKVHPPS